MAVIVEEKIVDPSPEKLLVGGECTVKQGKSCYKGQVAAIGKYLHVHVNNSQ